MSDQHVIKTLVLEILTQKFPEAELGARLKQNLNRKLTSQGLEPFDEKAFGYKKFADFLTGELAGQVTINRPSTSGDVSISLAVAPKAIKDSVNKLPNIKSQIWQAFTNPDPRRKRFFQRDSRKVVHFIEDTCSEIKTTVESNLENFIEIPFITADTQARWMAEFLSSTPIDVNVRTNCEKITSQPYNSGVNLAFTTALGELGKQWATTRTQRVISKIQEWAAEHRIPFTLLSVDPTPSKPLALPKTIQAQERPELHKAKALLETMSEEDLKTVIIPTLLSTLMIKYPV